MGIYVRCSKCHRFNVVKRRNCSNCDTVLKGSKSYYVRIANNGKRSFEYAGYNLTQARDFETRRKYEIRMGVPDTEKSMAFDDYVDNIFIPHYEAKNKSVSTEMHKFNSITKFFGNKPLNEIIPQNIDEYYQNKLKTCKPATAKNHLAIIRRMFNYAIEMGYLHSSPVKTKPKTFNNERVRYLSEDEKRRFLEACKASKSRDLYYMVIVALNTGMRLGEIRKLKPADISGDVIKIKAENSKNSKMRVIPLTDTLKELFKNLPEFDFDKEIRWAFKRAAVRASVNDFHFHDLRHTFASELVMRGVDLYTVSKLLGHSSIEMTQRYAHLAPTALINAIATLNG